MATNKVDLGQARLVVSPGGALTVVNRDNESDLVPEQTVFTAAGLVEMSQPVYSSPDWSVTAEVEDDGRVTLTGVDSAGCEDGEEEYQEVIFNSIEDWLEQSKTHDAFFD